MSGLVYDTGALLAAERTQSTMWALHRRTLERGVRPVVPAVVLGQAWRGGSQPQLSRLLHGCAIEAFDERTGRAAGRLLGATHTTDVVDAAVIVAAVRLKAAVVTSDIDDLSGLIEAGGRSVRLHRI